MVAFNNKNVKKILISLVLIALMVGFLAVIAPGTNAYICKTQACEDAKAKMQEEKNTAEKNMSEANSVSEIIDQLSGEISSLNKQIAENETKIANLEKEIKETEARLKDEQEALVELLVNMHFETEAEPILVLAGSTSISDLAEKTAREEVIKQEIVETGEKIKVAKEQLNKEKEEVEITLQANEGSRTALATKQNSQRELKEEYERNANEAEVQAKYWEEQLKLLAWTPPSNTTGNGSRWNGTSNSYPYRDNCPQDNVRYSAYGGAVCQCTSYASWKAKEKWGISNTWGGHASSYIYASGYTVPSTGIKTYVDSNPAPNTIAIWQGGAYGHVAWVESVNADGSINISEYNVSWSAIGCYAGDYCSRTGVGSAGVRFLHFE